MTPERQRIKIAEACGFKFKVDDAGFSLYMPITYQDGTRQSQFQGSYHTGKRHSQDDWDALDSRMAALTPDYPGDLNAVQKAIGTRILTIELCLEFQRNLLRVIRCDDVRMAFLWNVSAGQLAEAFLRTLGMWEEDL